MPFVQIAGPDGQSRRFEHRGTPADQGVLKQIFVQKDYAINRLRRGQDIKAQYEAILAQGKTPIIVDAGANIGASIVYWGLNFPRAQILAVEPDAANFALMEQNTQGLNVSLHHAAIGSCDGHAILSDPGAGEWGYRTSLAAAGPVRVLSMASLLAQTQSQPDQYFIVKIDIEGAEADLFAANTEWVQSFPLLIIELHDWLLPGQGTSRNFLKCIAALDRDFVHIGENIFSIRN